VEIVKDEEGTLRIIYQNTAPSDSVRQEKALIRLLTRVFYRHSRIILSHKTH